LDLVLDLVLPPLPPDSPDPSDFEELEELEESPESELVELLLESESELLDDLPDPLLP
jgi:hypothetical protein